MRTALTMILVGALAGSASAAIGETAPLLGQERLSNPTPLRGAPLPRPSRLRLLVADNPPFVLDVDRGTTRRLRGVPRADRGVLWVVSVGGRGAVAVSDAAGPARLYGVRVRGVRVRVASLGAGVGAWAESGGRSVWILSRDRVSGCRLRLVSLDGRLLRPARRFPCPTGSDPSGGSLGLVVHRTSIVDSRSGRVVLRTRAGVIAGAGRTLVLRERARRLTLLDATTDKTRSLGWPSALTGLDSPAVDSRGRFIALAFAEPAGRQVADIWVLDTRNARLRHVPGMPAFVALKFTSTAWTADGRLVLLGEDGKRQFVATWRPGERQLRIKTLRFPERRSGSDTFAPLR